MGINIDNIKTQLKIAYEFVSDKAGKLANHVIKVVKEDPRAAGVAVAVYNIILFETTMRITALIGKIFCPKGESVLKAISLVTLWLSMFGAMNVLLYQKMKLPLTPAITAAISTGTFASYFFLKYMRSNKS